MKRKKECVSHFREGVLKLSAKLLLINRRFLLILWHAAGKFSATALFRQTLAFVAAPYLQLFCIDVLLNKQCLQQNKKVQKKFNLYAVWVC